MDWHDAPRLTDAELSAFFDRLFPHGFAGADVAEALVPNGWEQSPLLARFHPSVERIFEEQVRIHRNIESLRLARNRRDEAAEKPAVSAAEPTLEQVRREYVPSPVRSVEELTERLP